MRRSREFAKRAPRVDLRKSATLINADLAEIQVTVLDISGSGFRLKVSDNLKIGEFVTLRVDSDVVPAQIRWVLGEEAGGAFLAPIDSSWANGSG